MKLIKEIVSYDPQVPNTIEVEIKLDPLKTYIIKNGKCYEWPEQDFCVTSDLIRERLIGLPEVK